MRRHRWLARFALWIAVALAAGSLAAGSALAQDGRVPVDVLVTHLGDEGSGVDPKASRLDKKLREQFKYSSLKVLQERRLDLALDEVGKIDLPNGRSARIRPISRGENGVLMAVDVEGAVKTDVRARSGHLVVIRAGPYQGGNLVLSIEPDYE